MNGVGDEATLLDGMNVAVTYNNMQCIPFLLSGLASGSFQSASFPSVRHM